MTVPFLRTGAFAQDGGLEKEDAFAQGDGLEKEDAFAQGDGFGRGHF
jgi:hypothetical protein